tara:strand:+ start:99 stop:710 length:612 start_codon:yes stop_codon:yes gene_type:complete
MKNKTFNRDKLINTIKKVVGDIPIFSVSSTSTLSIEQYINANSHNESKFLEFFKTNFVGIPKDGTPFISVIFDSIKKFYCIQKYTWMDKGIYMMGGITVSNEVEHLKNVTYFGSEVHEKRKNDFECGVCFEKFTTPLEEFRNNPSLYNPEDVYIRCVRCCNNVCLECSISMININNELKCPFCRLILATESNIKRAKQKHKTH